MRGLVIAPTATWKRKNDSIDNIVNDHTNSVNIKQKITAIVPKGTNKTHSTVAQKTYFDMRSIHHLHERNRLKDLDVFEHDMLYDKRPLYGISYPEMKLRQKDITGY